jgi:lysophospholipase L1-like esterase
MSRHRSSNRTVLRGVIRVLVVLVLAGAVTVLVVRAYDRTRSAPEAPTAAPHGSPAAQDGLYQPNPTLLVVVDSMGAPPDLTITKAYPEIIGEKMGWNVVVDSVGGRGFMANDLSNVGVNKVVPPVMETLKDDADHYKADYILVDTGRNDLGGKEYTAVAVAADEYLTALRAAYPNAKVIVMLPSYISPVKADLYPLIAEPIRQSAERIGAVVLDPVGEKWYEGVDLAPFLFTDMFHLNDAGAQFYAQKILDDLRKLGITPYSGSTEGAP